ncbi:HAMP domain-containing sensor histidine kinase [Salinisphaera sp. T31B1]|uniref:sensor histidine kinase n=1 Tax=Salinisphaera sp. T31B1 TaxID=727963 RepID=UPI00333E51DC
MKQATGALSSTTERPGRAPAERRRRRIFVRPRSITGLMLASFAVVALPLIVAIVFSVIYVDRLTDQSERLVLQGVEVTRYSKRLSSLLIGMERSARQYEILESGELITRFERQAGDFNQMLDALAALELDTLPNWNLDALRRQTDALSSRLARQPEQIGGAIEQLGAMQRETDLIADQGNLFVDRELARLQSTAANARTFLLLCVFALIPGALILTAFFVTVISRPLRQIADAVTRLGDGDFERRIRVVAPAAELDTLGARLDWMRRRLATLENEKQQFIRHMSHELKTPLASIREGSELLRDGTVGALTQSQAEVADILQKNSVELAELIDNLLDFAAWQQHHAKLEYERFDLTALFEAIAARQRLTIEGKQLNIVTPGKAFAITADRDRMHLIIDNLLANAVKFSPAGGIITLDASRLDQATSVRVADQGPGVAADERAAIFDAFYQSRDSQRVASGGVRGTGIGLSVVRECVEAHGGSIRVDESPGGGALFTVQIPDRHAL